MTRIHMTLGMRYLALIGFLLMVQGALAGETSVVVAPAKSAITICDYIIIGFYLAFMLAIGVVFRWMSKDTSDYFRAGGAMPWWLTGVSAWYFFTSLFYKAAPAEEQERIDKFFTNLTTPVDKHGVEGVQTSIYKLIGALCLVYGGFILLLMAIPNRGTGRLAFLFCGGVMFAVGLVLFKIGKRKEREAASRA